MEWFNKNDMVLNGDKCYYMCLGKNKENGKFYFDGNTYVNSEEEKYYELS